jgi:hypothetical protein
MKIRDFVACRSFSENGLWQTHEEPGHSGVSKRLKGASDDHCELIVAPLMGQL